MLLDPFTLQAGHQFTAATVVISAAEARAYLEAVGDATAVHRGDAGVPSGVPSGPLPPLLLIAHGIRALMSELDVRPGTVHVAQELENVRPAFAAQLLRYEASVSRATTRQGARFLVVDVTIFAIQGPVCRGRTTLVIPQGAPGVAQAQ